MKLRCIFGLHSWKFKSSKDCEIYEDCESKRPYKRETALLFKCEHCYEYKVKKIDEAWDLNEEDK